LTGLLTRIRDNGKRFVVDADEKLTAFLELESAIVRVPPNQTSILFRFFGESSLLSRAEEALIHPFEDGTQ